MCFKSVKTLGALHSLLWKRPRPSTSAFSTAKNVELLGLYLIHNVSKHNFASLNTNFISTPRGLRTNILLELFQEYMTNLINVSLISTDPLQAQNCDCNSQFLMGEDVNAEFRIGRVDNKTYKATWY